MFENFIIVLVVVSFFIVGCMFMYDLFYKGNFFTNHHGLFGGSIEFGISLLLVSYPGYGIYYAFKEGILGLLLKDFFIVMGWIIVLGIVFLLVLRKIHK